MATLYEYEEDFTIQELKEQYKKMRVKFNKRIARLSEIDNSQRVGAFQRGGYKYQRSITDIENLQGRKNWTDKSIKSDWAKRVAELDVLLNTRTLSLSGREAIKRDTIQTLQDAGYTSINAKTYSGFVSFMNWAKQSGVLAQYDSEKLVEAYDSYLDNGELPDSVLESVLDDWFSLNSNEDIFG